MGIIETELTSYKDLTITLGSSDAGDIQLHLNMNVIEDFYALHFQEDGTQKAHIVPESFEIPSHYSKEITLFPAESIIFVYDDDGFTYSIACNRIDVYRAGMRGCLLKLYSETGVSTIHRADSKVKIILHGDGKVVFADA